jgi:hypothetical protein
VQIKTLHKKSKVTTGASDESDSDREVVNEENWCTSEKMERQRRQSDTESREREKGRETERQRKQVLKWMGRVKTAGC